MASAAVGGGGSRVAVWLKAEDLQCSICLHLLSSPTTLLCGHSFCGGCIRRWGETKAEGRGRSCPICGHDLPKKLPERNVLLESLLRQYRCAAASLTEGRLAEVGLPLTSPSNSEQCVQVDAVAKGGVQDVVKITEISQQIEEAIEATANWSRDSTKMKDSVSQTKTSLREGFSAMRKYISHQEEVVLNFIDEKCAAAQQRINETNEQFTARTQELLELQMNAEELMKTISPDQKIHIGSPVTVNKAKLGIQMIYNMIQTVEVFKRQLEMTVLENYPAELLQGTSSETNSMNEIHMDVAEDGMGTSINSSQPQESPHQKTSSCSSAGPHYSDSPVPTILSQYSQWTSNVTFDLERLHHRLELSKDKRKVMVSPYLLQSDNSSKRFRKSQVLASQGFSEGCHYWEVSTKDCRGWAIGIAREEIKSDDQLGRNELSWCIEWSNNCLSAWHRDKKTQISEEKPKLIGVFLDIPESHLHFHSLTSIETHLHSFQINVVSPVYPAFWIYGMDVGGSLTIRDVKKC